MEHVNSNPRVDSLCACCDQNDVHCTLATFDEVCLNGVVSKLKACNVQDGSATTKTACMCGTVGINPGEVCNYKNVGKQLAVLSQCTGRCYKHTRLGENYKDISALKPLEKSCKQFIKPSDVDYLTNTFTAGAVLSHFG